MKQHKKRGLLASVGALVTAAALALSGAAAAQAAPVVTQATGSLTVHKLADPGGELGMPTGQSSDTPPAGATAIPGVTYKITKLAPNLGTNQGWIDAGAMTVTAAESWIASNPDADTYSETTANPNGEAVFNGAGGAGLPIGQYLVEETATPDGVTKASSFLVTVPVTNPAGDGWVYDVHVYPKNSQVDINKGVIDATFSGNGDRNDTYAVGGNVTWTIDTAVPVNRVSPNSQEIAAPAGFAILDSLDSKLTYVENTVSIVASGDNKIVLIEDTDYEVEGNVKIVFLEAGLKKLKDAAQADANSRVVADIVTTVNASGEITNGATVYPDSDGANPGDQGLETTNSATVKYGKYSFTKVSTKETTPGTKDPLGGATFRVYPTKALAEAGEDGYLTVNGETEWTSAPDTGLVEIDGLRFSNWFDNTDQAAAPHSYWLVETKAPKNHQLILGPIEITVDALTTQGDDVVNVSTEDQPGFALPLTGGMGTAILTMVGIAILAIVLFVARRRRSEEAAQ